MEFNLLIDYYKKKSQVRMGVSNWLDAGVNNDEWKNFKVFCFEIENS